MNNLPKLEAYSKPIKVSYTLNFLISPVTVICKYIYERKFTHPQSIFRGYNVDFPFSNSNITMCPAWYNVNKFWYYGLGNTLFTIVNHLTWCTCAFQVVNWKSQPWKPNLNLVQAMKVLTRENHNNKGLL